MPTSPPQHIVLDGIRWETYESLLADLADRAIRLSYDDGVLEIMNPSIPHEHIKRLLGRMIEAMTEELELPIRSGGSVTWRRRELKKGLEPDECYWIQNEPRVRGRAITVGEAPPPDLALEVDIFSKSTRRLPIYAALGIPEVWRHDAGRLTVYLLAADASYQTSSTSRCFPWLPVAEFAARLARWEETDETTWIRGFRAWVRELELP